MGKEKIIGIDLGTSNSEAAVTKRTLFFGLYGESFLATERSVMTLASMEKLKRRPW